MVELKEFDTEYKKQGEINQRFGIATWCLLISLRGWPFHTLFYESGIESSQAWKCVNVVVSMLISGLAR